MAISNVSSGLRGGVCTSTTRPTAPFEGQMIYETDTDMMAIWNGTAWRYIAATTATSGTVLQVVNSTTNSQTLTGSSSFTDTNLSATITPKSTTSKILVIANQNGLYKTGSNTRIQLKLFRSTTEILNFEGYAAMTASSADNGVGSSSVTYLDSPSTTSAVTYKTQFASTGNTANVYVQAGGSSSSMTLMEIAG
jgi:hypothetical protein